MKVGFGASSVFVSLVAFAACSTERNYHPGEAQAGEAGESATGGSAGTKGGTGGRAGSGSGGSTAARGGSSNGGSSNGGSSNGGSSNGGSSRGGSSNGGSSNGGSSNGGSSNGGTTNGGEAGQVTATGGTAGMAPCPEGFTGEDCSVNIDDCKGVTCPGHSHCTDGIAKYTCTCEPGYTGMGCDLPRFELLTPGFGMSCGNALSADGSVIVGYLADTPRSSIKPFRWTEDEGALPLMSNTDSVDYGQATGVSADGSVVSGYAGLASGSNGTFRWTQADGITLIGLGDQAFISSNGSTLVGRDTSQSDGVHLYRWTVAGGSHDYGSYGDVLNLMALSGDGTVVVGNLSEQAADLSAAFLWTSGDGMRTIGPSNVISSANAVTADGRIAVGSRTNEAGGELYAFRWDRQNGPVDLELGPITYTSATGITADGSVIVGTTSHDSWIWSSTDGARLFSEVLADKGVDMTGLSDFRVSSVSNDGAVITGCAFKDGVSGIQAFIARVGD